MAIRGAIAIGHDGVFPHGCYVVGEVEPVRDFDRSTKETAVQAVDRDSGLPVWRVDVIDADPDARDKTVRVTVLGASLRELMQRMGHASSEAALRYQHATSDRDRAIADALDRLADEQDDGQDEDEGHDRPI
jgi:hypothetical protein